MFTIDFLATALPIVLGVVLIGAGSVNFAGPPSVRASFARWGYPTGFHRVTGTLEVAAGLLLLFPATALFGGLASLLLLLAASATLIRFGEWNHLPPALILLILSAAATAFTSGWI